LFRDTPPLINEKEIISGCRQHIGLQSLEILGLEPRAIAVSQPRSNAARLNQYVHVASLAEQIAITAHLLERESQNQMAAEEAGQKC
jgi:hypothetical protein